jgi:hypothetical protein
MIGSVGVAPAGFAVDSDAAIKANSQTILNLMRQV